MMICERKELGLDFYRFFFLSLLFPVIRDILKLRLEFEH